MREMAYFLHVFCCDMTQREREGEEFNVIRPITKVLDGYIFVV